jgi:3-hydroxyisobutyrate dehydrogenase-like beta-hydroxyacid dehydrogenase
MAKLAFLGLGAMGAPMALRLAEAGHDLTVWNRTRSKAEDFTSAAMIADSPRDAADKVDAVITMLTSPEAVSEVWFGRDGVLSAVDPGTTLIEMSTVGPDFIIDASSRLPEEVLLVDAPVLGSVSNAEEGSLNIFFGGSDEAFSRWNGVLAPMGSPIYLGAIGSGAAMKLVANATLAALMSTVGEALSLADGFGLDRQRAIPALLKSPIGPAMSRKLDKIESGDYTPSFKLSLMNKDMRLIVEAARQRQVDLKVAQAAAEWIDMAESSGLGDQDYSAVIARITEKH